MQPSDEDASPRNRRGGLETAIGAALARLPRAEAGLHVVATPIGNLADIGLRALKLLDEADLVLCEDTRMTRRLLDRYGLRPRLLSYHEHSPETRRDQVLGHLAGNAVVVLVSDAGTPLISDPGYKLVCAALEGGHPVHAVPGPSAAMAALVLSGLPTDRFWFEGFLPSKAGARRTRIAEIASLPGTLVLFESPRRVGATLSDLAAGLGARDAVLARELTKRHETIYRAPLSELAEQLVREGPPKGEIVLVVAPPEPGGGEAPDPAALDDRLRGLIAEAGTREAAARLAAETGLKRRDLYQRALRLAGFSGDG